MDDGGIDSWQEMLKNRALGWDISTRRLLQMYNMTKLFNIHTLDSWLALSSSVSIFTVIGESIAPLKGMGLAEHPSLFDTGEPGH